MPIKCPSYILKAISVLEQNGFSAYAVGGCVRDSLMGRTPNDWDMTTSAAPDQIKAAFKSFRTIPTGIKHGTVTVIIDSHNIEITTMRVDGVYADNRHPKSVSFTKKIEDDLSRRDFTVNAMAYNPKTGVVDPYGGRDDLKKRVIRCVGNADTRFNEDALRILRAVRFACVLDFDIEKETSESIIRNRALLSKISSERIRVELIKLLCGKNVEKILSDYKEVIFEIIPELRATDGFEQHSPYHIYDVWTHIIKVVAAIVAKPDFRVAALLHDVEKPSTFKLDENGRGHFKGHPKTGAQTAEKILRKLRFSNAEIKHITDIIRLHDERPDGDRFHLAKFCVQEGIDTVEDTLKLIEADLYGKNPSYIKAEIPIIRLAEEQLRTIRASRICLNTAELDINGNDIMALGFDRTKIRSALLFLLDEVIYERVENQKEALCTRLLNSNLR